MWNLFGKASDQTNGEQKRKIEMFSMANNFGEWFLCQEKKIENKLNQKKFLNNMMKQ